MATPVGLRNRVALQIPGSTAAAASNALLGDPLPTTKGSAMGMQFSEWGTGFVWAPYHKIAFRWAPYLILLFLAFVLAVVMGTAVPVVASYSTSTSVALNALPVAAITFIVLLLGMNFRSLDQVPQYMAPYLVFAEMFHGYVGAVVALPLIAVMLGGAALTAPILTAMGGTSLPNYATAARPITFWGAVGLQTALVAMGVYVYQQNQTVAHYHLAIKEKRGRQRAFKKTSIFFSLASAVSVFIGFGNGLYSVGNFVVTFGSYINTGAWSVPDTAACTLDLAWPFVGALVGWALHLLTWNVNGLTAPEVQLVVQEEEAAESQED